MEAIYWVLLILFCVAPFVPPPFKPYGSSIILLVLLAIVGMKIFGFPPQ